MERRRRACGTERGASSLSGSSPWAAASPRSRETRGESIRTRRGPTPAGSDNSIDVGAFETAAREQLAAGKAIAAIVATMGTTDAFGIDDLEDLHPGRPK